MWEGDGFWRRLPPNLLWSHLSGNGCLSFWCTVTFSNPKNNVRAVQIHLTVIILFPLNQDGSKSGSAKGYFLVPEDNEWPNCVRGDPKTFNIMLKDKNWDNSTVTFSCSFKSISWEGIRVVKFWLILNLKSGQVEAAKTQLLSGQMLILSDFFGSGG